MRGRNGTQAQQYGGGSQAVKECLPEIAGKWCPAETLDPEGQAVRRRMEKWHFSPASSWGTCSADTLSQEATREHAPAKWGNKSRKRKTGGPGSKREVKECSQWPVTWGALRVLWTKAAEWAPWGSSSRGKVLERLLPRKKKCSWWNTWCFWMHWEEIHISGEGFWNKFVIGTKNVIACNTLQWNKQYLFVAWNAC